MIPIPKDLNKELPSPDDDDFFNPTGEEDEGLLDDEEEDLDEGPAEVGGPTKDGKWIGRVHNEGEQQ